MVIYTIVVILSSGGGAERFQLALQTKNRGKSILHRKLSPRTATKKSSLYTIKINCTKNIE